MHMIFGAVLHVTVLSIIGYLLLFSATRTAGIVALIGRLLGIWMFILAALAVVAVVTAPMFGGKPFGMEMMHRHGGAWMHRPGTPPPAPEKPAPATP